MSYRYMRVIIFFDLPSTTYEERKSYTKFRKFLLNEGFIMMQESVYSKIALNSTTSKLIQDRVRKNKAPKGIIQMMVITEKQFAGIEYVIGNNQNNVLDNTKRLVVF
ncbi:CRISPR-associated endonuclease Cas2 [Romboutsia sedimentorum]|uniref:CRISPR-associated endoribonuclease Cas2 n=1 Tax=Romboutsia sedimentorum TaxID=1368474 RepID=A0ABT7E8L8_9FIRM|nr:CRISPR-associated endonuclease Cas2 [Romboutsia sedimentorum]MDK2563279.1 CRISPR-associated endonuclease Cas2 [Romboutsia sedimentorum]